MPWELSIYRTRGKPPKKYPKKVDRVNMGGLAKVQRLLSKALTGTIYFVAPYTKLHRATYEGEDCRFEFWFGPTKRLVEDAILDVSGKGNPMNAVLRIMEVTGWGVYDIWTMRLVEAGGWKKFKIWRRHCRERYPGDDKK